MFSGKTNKRVNWEDANWNPIRGCKKVSDGCSNCYAMRNANAMNRPGAAYYGLTFLGPRGPEWTNKVVTAPKMLRYPVQWKKAKNIVVSSMSDVFHDGVPASFIEEIFDVMRRSPQHTFMITTKRPERMQKALLHMTRDSEALPNVWLGVSVEHQHAADTRIPFLSMTPAALRFVVCEPLLGPIDFNLNGDGLDIDQLVGDSSMGMSGVDWVLAGGESGLNARPMYPSWLRKIRNQASKNKIPFHFKQWGAWAPYPKKENPVRSGVRFLFEDEEGDTHERPVMWHLGKRLAGQTLDGKVHNKFPEPVVDSENDEKLATQQADDEK